MKTYLFDTINRYKRFSENLDVKTILCNKSWWVFNDSGEKEVYIFQHDGSLIISVSGKVINATWRYISANKSLIISGNNRSYMVHPAFMDNVLFALQLDGTNDVAFLIDENILDSFAPKSFEQLESYFKNKEKQIEREAKQLELQEIQQCNDKTIEEQCKKEREIRRMEAISLIKQEFGYKWRNVLSMLLPVVTFLYIMLPLLVIILVGNKIVPFDVFSFLLNFYPSNIIVTFYEWSNTLEEWQQMLFFSVVIMLLFFVYEKLSDMIDPDNFLEKRLKELGYSI